MFRCIFISSWQEIKGVWRTKNLQTTKTGPGGAVVHPILMHSILQCLSLILFLIKVIFSSCYRAKKKIKKRKSPETMWRIMSVQYQICMDIYYCCLQYWSFRQVWRNGVKSESSPADRDVAWLAADLCLQASCWVPSNSECAVERWFSFWRQHQIRNAFRFLFTDFSQIETMNTSVVKRFLTL